MGLCSQWGQLTFPRYNLARNQIRKYERDEIVEELIRYYLKGQSRLQTIKITWGWTLVNNEK